MRVARAASVDVVLGVLCSAALASVVTEAHLPLIWWFLLPAATWSVYSLDHLLDARRTGADAHSFRHAFFFRQRQSMLVLLLIVVGTGGVAALLWWPRDLWPPALLVSVAAAVHLRMAQRRAPSRWPKELSGAVTYTAGIWFAPLMRAPMLDRWTATTVGMQFLAALLNLLAFALFEKQSDTLDGFTSIPRTWGDRASRVSLIVLTGLGLLSGVVGLVWGPAHLGPAFIVLVLLVVLPSAMTCFATWFARNERYRFYGDLAFLLMVLPVWVHFHVP